jgi:hypothetical protein
VLPAILEIETGEEKEVMLMINSSNASVRCGVDTCSVPFSLGRPKWLRIILGQEARKVELRASHGESKIDKSQVYKGLDVWKGAVKEEITNLHHFYLQPLLGLLKVKMEKK